MVREGSLHERNMQCIVLSGREMFIRRKVITAALIPITPCRATTTRSVASICRRVVSMRSAWSCC